VTHQGGCGQTTSGWTVNHNLTPDGSGAGTGSVTGSPTWTGGANPSTCLGFQLASGSHGKGAASGATDMGSTALALVC
jgi:hypothetical protein